MWIEPIIISAPILLQYAPFNFPLSNSLPWISAKNNKFTWMVETLHISLYILTSRGALVRQLGVHFSAYFEVII